MATNRSRLAPNDTNAVLLNPHVWRFAVHHLLTSLLAVSFHLALLDFTGSGRYCNSILPRCTWTSRPFARDRSSTTFAHSTHAENLRQTHDAKMLDHGLLVLGFHGTAATATRNHCYPSTRLGNNTPAIRSWLPPLQLGLSSCLSRSLLSSDLLSENVEKMHSISSRPMRHSNQAITSAVSTG